MAPSKLTFTKVPGISVSKGRGIGFLEGDTQLDAGDSFRALTEKEDMTMRARMDRWIDGLNGPAKYFHGFQDYKELHVFRLGDDRFYGFLCNPMPKSDGRFLLCALCIYDAKHKWETEDTIKKRIEQWRTNQAAIQAIAMVYPDIDTGGTKWKQ